MKEDQMSKQHRQSPWVKRESWCVQGPWFLNLYNGHALSFLLSALIHIKLVQRETTPEKHTVYTEYAIIVQ